MKADVVFEMDADLSHDPRFIPDLLQELEDGCDMVIGSRHVPGGEIQGWSIYRHLVSSTGNAIAKTALGIGVSDVTTGFRAFKAEALRKIDFETINSEGYGFQIETLFRSDRQGLKVGEAPIIFTDRRAGASKLGSRQILQFIRTVSRLFLVRLSGRSDSYST
jgi:dolichol-phosphate mannosyltransferase